MTKKEKLQHILETLDKIYGTTKDGFYHNQDWQLLTAIMLSAQSTDKQVDEALPGLFGRFRTAEEVAQAPVEEIEEYIRSVGLYKNKAKNMKKCCEQLVKDYGGKVPDKLEEVLKLAGCGKKDGHAFSGGCLWDSRGYSGYPCISDFPQAGLGKREKPPADGTGIDEGSAQGSLEPD